MVQESDFEHILPLSDIVEYLPGVSLKQLSTWASPGKNNGFPPPVETLGRYKYYDRDSVIKWFYLWKKMSKRLGRGKELNG